MEDVYENREVKNYSITTELVKIISVQMRLPSMP